MAPKISRQKSRKLENSIIYREFDFGGYIYSFENTHLYIGAILLTLNLIERRVLQILLILDLEIYKNLASLSHIRNSPLTNFEENENLTLGQLIHKLETFYEFDEKEEVVRQLKEVNRLRKNYIHKLMTNPERVQMGNRQSNKDTKKLKLILENLGIFVDKINNGWIGKRGKLLSKWKKLINL